MKNRDHPQTALDPIVSTRSEIGMRWNGDVTRDRKPNQQLAMIDLRFSTDSEGVYIANAEAQFADDLTIEEARMIIAALAEIISRHRQDDAVNMFRDRMTEVASSEVLQ
jgi:hypothetical protein